MSDHEDPAFANVIRVARFHQAPQRIQYLIEPGDNVVVLPVLRPPRRRQRHSFAEAIEELYAEQRREDAS